MANNPLQVFADASLASDLTNFAGTGLQSTAANDIHTTVSNEFNNVYTNTYGNLKSSVAANEASYYYSTRSRNLKDVQDKILDNVTSQVNTYGQNHDTALRQQEINQWANSDKLDTLFVFQFLFLSLMLMALLGYLWRINILSSGFLYFSGFLVLLINIIIIVIRSKYTRYLRNTRYWNRRKFNQFPAPPPTIPEVTCDSLSDTFGVLLK